MASAPIPIQDPPCSHQEFSYLCNSLSEIHMPLKREEEEPEVEEQPIDLLPGEVIAEQATFKQAIVILTNYRLVVLREESVSSVPLVAIESIDSGGQDELQVNYKEGRMFRICASSIEQSMSWYKLLVRALQRPNHNHLFFWSLEQEDRRNGVPWLHPSASDDDSQEWEEFARLQLDPSHFRVSDRNRDFSLCATYPQQIIVPRGISEEELDSCRDFRMLGRFPAVVWHNPKKGTVLLRSSQPRIGLLFAWNGNCVEDEKIIRLLGEYTTTRTGSDTWCTIIDCRSFASAYSNRIKGGGFENVESYVRTEIRYLGLPNIHHVRNSFAQLRALLVPPIDQVNFLTSLQATNWMSNLNVMLHGANECVDLLEGGRNVLVHCSDGWDRTTQLIGLTKIMADPSSRTIQGFERLVRRDWIAFGHKFADRNGIVGGDPNERCPVFLQWLDAVHQLYKKYPCEFEFSMEYLVKLAQHSYSGLFSSFSFNSLYENVCARRGRPGGSDGISVWRYLHPDNEMLLNEFYSPRETRLRCPEGVHMLVLWNEVYQCREVEGILKRHIKTDRPSTPVVHLSSSAEKGLVKSRSSDSIASTTLPADTPRTTEQEDALKPRNVRSRAADLDVDGLEKVEGDRRQEVTRRRRKEMAERIKLAQEQMNERIRKSSEKTDASSILEFPSEDSSIDSDDTSLVDHNEQHLGRCVGFSVNESKCSVCRAAFYPIARVAHNCGMCGRSVCSTCSGRYFHNVVDGRSKNSRACDLCYENMDSSTDRVLPSTSVQG